MNADEYEQYIRDRIAIAEAIIKTFHIDTSKVLVEEDKTGSVTLWFLIIFILGNIHANKNIRN